MEFLKVNWPGLACSMAVAALLALSILYSAPWWQASLGEGVGQAEISPLDYNANLAGASLETPIIWFLNLGGKLTLASCTVSMFIYSVSTRKTYSKQLLGFAYKKPIFTLTFFIAMLVVSTYMARSLFGVDILLMGTTTHSLSFGGASVNIPVSTSFTWVFWLAVAAAVLAVTAKIYDWKVIKTPSTQTDKRGK